MSAQAVRSVPGERPGAPEDVLRVGFLGSEAWLDRCLPATLAGGMSVRRFDVSPAPGAAAAAHEALERFRPQATVVLDPAAMPAELLQALPGLKLGVLVDGLPGDGASAASLDRLVSFDPGLTGARAGGAEVWRAIPPPVSDLLYAAPRERHHAPRAITVGRSTEYREHMLMPAKHHHDVLQVIHGVSGEPLVELLGECDVGIYVGREPGGRYGHQVGVHLAAGQLLLSEELAPAHGLERNIDYLTIESPEGLVWVLDRLSRFPEMHHAIRVRGHLKAQQYRASRVFSRILHDLVADVRAFG